jgi:hypothetical protein
LNCRIELHLDDATTEKGFAVVRKVCGSFVAPYNSLFLPFLKRWRSSVAQIRKKLTRWRKKGYPGSRSRIIKNTIVQRRRIADEHALQHLLDHPRLAYPLFADHVGAPRRILV